MRNLGAVGIHRSIWKVATLGNRVVLGISSPRDALLFQDVDNVVGIRACHVDRGIRVETKGRCSNVVKIIRLENQPVSCLL
jgi:hypothetical protein